MYNFFTWKHLKLNPKFEKELLCLALLVSEFNEGWNVNKEKCYYFLTQGLKWILLNIQLTLINNIVVYNNN